MENERKYLNEISLDLPKYIKCSNFNLKHQSLFDKFNNMYEMDEYSYYSRININPIKNPKYSNDFIKEYFSKGGKVRVFDIGKKKPILNNLRSKHTVYGFFLGFLLKDIKVSNNKLINLIENDFNRYDESFVEYEFSYLWFLTYLFHDYGYVLEDKYKNSSITLENIIRYENISFSLYSEKIYYPYHFKNKMHRIEECDRLCYLLPRYEFIYSKKTIKNYLKYKFDMKNNNVDHGIIGGLKFYHNLIANYWESYNKAKSLNPYIDIKRFYYNNLQWSTNQIDVFRHIGDIIVSHNIYKPQLGDIETYKCYGLEEIINKAKINIIEYPLFYLLSLVDTIEPTKKYPKEDTSRILKSISIELLDNNIIIYDNLKEDESYKNWRDAIYNLTNWLEIDIKLEYHRTIIKI
jgi:hypothetical protein